MTVAVLLFSIASQLAKMQRAALGPKFFEPEYVVFDRWSDHKPRTIFAALTHADSSQEIVAFRVSRTGALQRLAARETEIHNIELRDVTADGSPELLVTSSLGNRSAEVDILQWTGRRFDKIGETSDHGRFIDIDADGIPEIVDGEVRGENECGARTRTIWVQKLMNGRFEEDPHPHPHLVSVDAWTKQTGGREKLTLRWFLSDASPKKCRIRVRTKRVTSLHVTMRELDSDAGGRTIALRDGVRSIELPSRCTLAEVTVSGPRGASFVLLLDER